MTIDGISVQETIDLARNQLAQINVPEDNKSSIELLINLTSIMKDRLGINSSNSSKPPSKDDPKDKCQKDKRPASERSVGGQKGHQGSQLELVENPDDIIYIPIDKGVIPDGNHFISGYARRQVIDIKISRHIIEYRAEILSNEDGKTITAEFPSDVGRPAQYGASVKAHSVYMSLYQLIPYKRVAEHFNDNTDINISQGSLCSFNEEAYSLLESFNQWIIEQQCQAKVLNADETGININGILHWLHSLSNDKTTYFHPDEKRGSTAMDAMEVLPHFNGVLCHDHWKPYYKYGCIHALCNAHHVRELKRAYEQDNQEWAKKIEDLLKEMNKAVHISKNGVLSEEEITSYEHKYMDILESGKQECPEEEVTKGTAKKGRIKRTRARNLLNRLIKFKADALRFCQDADIPFTNNSAEREIRMTKVHQKVSGCFRTMDGAKRFCRIRSYIKTCQKHGIKSVEALRMLFDGETPEFMNPPTPP